MKSTAKHPGCFKSYDIRGKVPDELNPDIAYLIGSAYVQVYGVKKVIVGYDIRLSSIELSRALIRGVTDSGCDVVNIGLCGTEEMYHRVFSLEDQGVDGGIMITASHNPADYNGMKFVVQGAKPVTGESGLNRMAELVSENSFFGIETQRGTEAKLDSKDGYISHLLSYVDVEELRPLKVVVNNGNGCASPIIDLLEPELPFTFMKMHHTPNGSFPNGVPNPLLPEQQHETGSMVIESGADLGIGWDGDFDRCFFWDEKGNFIEGYYIVGLLAIELLAKEPKGTVLYDPRCVWNTEELVEMAGGKPVMCRTGHSYIKERMRLEDAVYGGEMSAHHYFRDFGYCDSGMVPWLLVCSLLCRKGVPLSRLVEDMISSFPVSGEINSVVDDPDRVIDELKQRYSHGKVELIDGLSVSFDNFRFNVRKSNTEPLLRLNVESRGDPELLKQKTEELLSIIKQHT